MARAHTKLHSPLMWAFRAMDDPDYKAAQSERLQDESGQPLKAGRHLSRAHGISEHTLLNEVRQDLQALLNTVNLNSSQDLSDFPEVQSSILNYGLPDLSVHIVDTVRIDRLADDIRSALIRFEPRMDPKTLHVERDQEYESDTLKVRFLIKAEIRCDPVRVGSEFIADVDPAFGRIKILGAAG
ncbi:type VI secretion system baseplate subunit TssE [Roseibium denhamense]|uniref:Type VI secretion system protein ImpF n=1 Tax=Roseibium denhamense TaxID=76305 RepID=A0ABY1NQT5_9HYPH|nr:type VI secretion system baseplate subunit TssE [Roseibium denhamense]MTI08037.1 type VI secretion system baseplate subunit TssE [Roseibium denhamense]SMP15775.1 type VI secretion system protein ImpF [Roseibium denhamense]